jgi:serine-type D-Ala-D-Ala carboxypeptidase/endopeptidase (penicillin-binding protein 4)
MDENEKTKKIFYLFIMNHCPLKIMMLILFTGYAGMGCLNTRIRVEGNRLDRHIKKTEIAGQNFSGFVLINPESGKTLYEYQGDRFFTPASNTKIFTLYTAKKILGDSIPSLTTGTRNDTLYFTGLGDPTFLHPDFKTHPSFNFLADKDMPLIYVPGTLYDNRYGPGWAWDDYPYYFSAEKSSFPVFGNTIHVSRSRGSAETCIIPRILENTIEINPDTVNERLAGTITIGRYENENRFSLFYKEPVDSFDVKIPFIVDERLIRDLLEDTLNREVLLGEKFPDIWQNIIYSQPVDSLLRPMMTESDNFFAEQLLLMCGFVLFDSLDSEKTIRYAASNFFPHLSSEMFWIDGSGLSRYNQFTPHAMAGVLSMIYLEYGKEFIAGIFPEGGVSGTMKNNFPELKNFVRAKTGSMSHVYNLSGFLVTKKGKWLIFSFMNNNFTRPSSEIRREITRILLAVKNRF